MSELFYYTIFAIILYFLLSSVFENFYFEQENFDPSLVPVSSIVTLAKIAQKLANNSGLLTIPGNLQLNSGNLTVTGSTNVVGQATSSGPNNSLVLNKFNWYSKDKIARLSNNPANDILTIDSSGNMKVNGNLTTFGFNKFNNGGTENLLPHSDGQNYLRNKVVINSSNASICAHSSCNGTGTISTPGNINVTGKLTGLAFEEFRWVQATIFSITNNLGRLPRCPNGSPGYNCGLDPWAGLDVCPQVNFPIYGSPQPNDCLCLTSGPNPNLNDIIESTYQRIKKGQTCNTVIYNYRY